MKRGGVSCSFSGQVGRRWLRSVSVLDASGRVIDVKPSSSLIIKGRAKKEKMEERIAARFASKSYRKPTSKTEWTLSPFGFSGRSVTPVEAAHSRALKKAIHMGCNVVDTASTGNDRQSERYIGQILTALTDIEDVREATVVMGKGGYYLKGSKKAPDSVEIGGLCHSIHPSFIEGELTESMKNLRLETMDIYMLHDPERFLMHTEGATRDSFYQKMEETFRHLEKEVDRGRIQYYGIVSSSGLTEPSQSKSHVSLEALMDIAKRVRSNNHFAAVAYPFNPFEPNALILNNQANDTLSVSECAKKHSLLRFSTRPLTIKLGGKPARLVSYASHSDRDLPVLVSQTFDLVAHLEKTYPGRVDPSLPNVKEIAWAQIIANNSDKITNIYEWENVMLNFMRPTLLRTIPRIAERNEHSAWLSQYNMGTTRLMERFTEMMEANMHKFSEKLAEIFAAGAPELADRQTLQQQALLAAESSGVSDCILHGMVMDEFVREALLACWVKPLEKPLEWKKFAEHVKQETASLVVPGGEKKTTTK